MLELRNIKKDYPAGDGAVHALKGINLQFRDSEFVSILGPSGCGKTTMLNLIGGLDHYTDGDLLIGGKSTRDFRNSDWDAYRNHSIGFVFQSYNLIPHQTVLRNVELALTIAGVSKQERRERATAALIEVGLGDQLKKRPSELSGGQMQRVAIARALVNNPEILLADEPTGALDTETSLQVMEILKRVSEKRLVIMVTHNPELAEKYSTRIIRMLDGLIIDDTAPLTDAEYATHRLKDNAALEAKKASKKKEKKPSMSLATAFMLSLKNLFTKKGRTILTSFAGSIGIIGIALIFSVSNGMTTYIDTLQEDTLSAYPLTLEAQHTDLSSMLESFMGSAQSGEKHENDAVYQKQAIYDLLNAFANMKTTENDLKSFKAYLDAERKDENSPSGLHSAVSGVQYTYNYDLLIYTQNIDNKILRSDTTVLMNELLKEHLGFDMSAMMGGSGGSTQMGGIMGMMSSSSAQSSGLWQELLPGDNGKPINPLIEKQYELVYGSYPNSYNEILLVLDENNEIDDVTLYALGLVSKEQVDAVMESAISGKPVDESLITKKKWTYEEICAQEYRTILPADCYRLNEETGLYEDWRMNDVGLGILYKDYSIPLRVVGIVKPNEDAVAGMLTGTICYTSQLTEYIAEHNKASAALIAQLENGRIDVFTGLPFKDTSDKMTGAEKLAAIMSYVNDLDERGKADFYVRMMSVPTAEEAAAAVGQMYAALSQDDINAMLLLALSSQMSGVDEETLLGYIASMPEAQVKGMVFGMLDLQYRENYAKGVAESLAAMSDTEKAGALTATLQEMTEKRGAEVYDHAMKFSDTTYEQNVRSLGYIDLAVPSSINLYASTFADKDVIVDAIARYNETVPELSRIAYTDYVGLMMSSITTIIDAITYVLVAFVAISLIVSSIMIGVITLISVQERTKEIGILRALGASKGDVSSMFNAETVIIGFTSGLLGVIVTYLLCIPINLILYHFTGISGLRAMLPIGIAIALTVISMLLTLLAGVIPSRSAAKKDPVVALRTE